MQLELFNPDGSSWKTSKELSVANSKETTGQTQKEHQFCSMSLESWNELVTKQRGEYSQRLKSASLTSASGSSSWPTPQTSDMNGAANPNRPAHRIQLRDVETGYGLHQQDQDSSNTGGSHPESLWGTPAANDANKTPRCEVNSKQGGLAKSVGQELLRQTEEQEQNWATPTARDNKSGRGNKSRSYKELTPQVERSQSGKLNPRWVETLMGLPIGWTMPSCAEPWIIAPMNSDSSETEWSLQPLQERGKHSLDN